ncbi:hypothetical protein LARI1_G002762 [Lachnellula arida]|uniref:Rhodopsin domain-containing protein n=1 Tax=Lachnellula arida TaxID=1316785 RepID=A0A8T9BLV5_9HELO|nr:hypothetical protein LARI1_G002762 [Lachnellula arida]
MFLAGQAPASVDSGPVSTDSHGARILGVTSFFTAFACTAVILRVYVRIFMLKLMGADDYVMLVAMVCSVAILSFVVLEVQLGVGEHFGNPHLMKNYDQILHWTYHHSWILIVGISGVKISVGIFLLRLIQGKMYRELITTLTRVFYRIFQCLPVEAAWNHDLKANTKSKCFSTNVFRNIGLFNGDSACAASIVKEYYLAIFFANVDNQFIELNSGILAACLPTLRPLFATLLKNRSILKCSDPNNRARVGGARHRYFPQQDDKELLSMPSRSTFSGTIEEDYGVGISGGNASFGDGRKLHGHDSVVSSNPTSRLGNAIEEDDGVSENCVMSRPQGLHRAHVQRGQDSRDWWDQRDWNDPGKGIFKMTEFSVTR